MQKRKPRAYPTLNLVPKLTAFQKHIMRVHPGEEKLVADQHTKADPTGSANSAFGLSALAATSTKPYDRSTVTQLSDNSGICSEYTCREECYEYFGPIKMSAVRADLSREGCPTPVVAHGEESPSASEKGHGYQDYPEISTLSPHVFSSFCIPDDISLGNGSGTPVSFAWSTLLTLTQLRLSTPSSRINQGKMKKTRSLPNRGHPHIRNHLREP
jgi:hypothetical protein